MNTENLGQKRQGSTLIVAAIGLAIPAWSIAFNLGVYGTVLYNHLFIILAASIAILLSAFVLRKSEFKQARLGWCQILLLILPSAWLLLEIVLHQTTSPYFLTLRFVMSLATGLVSLPYIAYYLVIAIIPGVDGITTMKHKMGLFIIVAIVSGIGFLSGQYHYYVLSCNDFQLAGDSVPDNCWEMSVDGTSVEALQ
ncbi:MAG: hypothetical protein GKR96_05620 [Gammaproteobacteria bacterium]|nr:hypothetical protein [Gammaproteobacteria bacterium]